LGFSWSKKG